MRLSSQESYSMKIQNFRMALTYLAKMQNFKWELILTIIKSKLKDMHQTLDWLAFMSEPV